MEILNGNQAREFNRAQKLAGFYDEQNKVYPLYPPYAQEVDLFLGYNQQLIDTVSGKDVNGEGITKSKEALKESVATMGNTICTRVAAYAKKIGDTELETAIYHRAYEIKRLKDGDVLGFVNRLIAIVTPLLTDELFQTYDVTEDRLSKIRQAATDFTNSIGKASLIDDQSSIASNTINDLLSNIRGNVVQFGLLINFFEEKNPAFVQGYYKAAAIDMTGIHHSGIKGIIINSTTEQPVEEATITLKGKKNSKTTTTGEEGAYQITKFRPGKGKLTVTAPNFNTQVIEVTIIRGKTLEFNIGLQSQAINLVTA